MAALPALCRDPAERILHAEPARDDGCGGDFAVRDPTPYSDQVAAAQHRGLLEPPAATLPNERQDRMAGQTDRAILSYRELLSSCSGQLSQIFEMKRSIITIRCIDSHQCLCIIGNI